MARAEAKKIIEAAKAEGKKWGIPISIDNQSEVYHVREAVWKAADMESFGGCLCIGCLEKRLGRKLKPKDFQRGHGYNLPRVPGHRD